MDIVATNEKIQIKYVIQCKNLSKKVGIDAVQQVSSGLEQYDGDMAIVVSNSGYTSQAKQLAKKQRVKLLHPDDLEHL